MKKESGVSVTVILLAIALLAAVAYISYQHGQEAAKKTSPADAPAPGAEITAVTSPGGAPQTPVAGGIPVQGQQAGSPPPAHIQVPGGAPPVAAAGQDADLEQQLQQMEAMRLENEIYRNRLQQGGGAPADPATGTIAPGSAPAATGAISPTPVQESATGAITTSPAGQDLVPGAGAPAGPAELSEEVDLQELAALERQVREATPLAKVKYFNAQWNAIEISGGSANNLKEGDKVAVRSDGRIVGYVTLTEVHEDTSMGKVVSTNLHSVSSLKPRVGDDVIMWPTF